jgi:hypothetical protein
VPPPAPAPRRMSVCARIRGPTPRVTLCLCCNCCGVRVGIGGGCSGRDRCGAPHRGSQAPQGPVHADGVPAPYPGGRPPRVAWAPDTCAHQAGRGHVGGGASRGACWARGSLCVGPPCVQDPTRHPPHTPTTPRHPPHTSPPPRRPHPPCALSSHLAPWVSAPPLPPGALAMAYPRALVGGGRWVVACGPWSVPASCIWTSSPTTSLSRAAALPMTPLGPSRTPLLSWRTLAVRVGWTGRA